ncbi:hypothetical protein BDY24DRAFT_4113 [Mrakia frigida]|uniref:uncharacterized protein n=1 Tax=Mrakia frigida TaxID=29902 RepID=UPI003FCC16DE
MSLVRSPITSINVQGDHFIATSFGPSPKLLYSPLDFSSSPMVILQPKKATDVWSSLFLPNGAVALGCDSHLLYTPSPLRSPHLSTHQTSSSSVLSLCSLPEEPACFLAGTRGGVVRLFDTRTFWRNGRGMEPVGEGGGGGVEAIKTASPVVGMKAVGGKNVVVAGMNGDLQIYDLRFLPQPSLSSTHRLPTSFGSSSHHHSKPKPKPFQQPNPSFTPTTPPTFSLPSHVNSYTTGLALLYHASSETVLAAGQDRKVRVWDARNGRLLEEDWGRKSGAGGWGGTVKGLVDLEEGRGVGSVDGERWEVWK